MDGRGKEREGPAAGGSCSKVLRGIDAPVVTKIMTFF